MNKKVATFGEQIRLQREDAKLSLREVAEQIGIDTSLLGKVAEKKVEYIKRNRK